VGPILVPNYSAQSRGGGKAATLGGKAVTLGGKAVTLGGKAVTLGGKAAARSKEVPPPEFPSQGPLARTRKWRRDGQAVQRCHLSSAGQLERKLRGRGPRNGACSCLKGGVGLLAGKDHEREGGQRIEQWCVRSPSARRSGRWDDARACAHRLKFLPAAVGARLPIGQAGPSRRNAACAD
jgi:hypothetical protein